MDSIEGPIFKKTFLMIYLGNFDYSLSNVRLWRDVAENCLDQSERVKVCLRIWKDYKIY